MHQRTRLFSTAAPDTGIPDPDNSACDSMLEHAPTDIQIDTIDITGLFRKQKTHQPEPEYMPAGVRRQNSNNQQFRTIHHGPCRLLINC